MSGTDFFNGHEIWLQQTKQFFEKGTPLFDHFFGAEAKKPEVDFADLDKLMKDFKEKIQGQYSFFDFIPKFKTQDKNDFSQYFNLLSKMTNDTVNLFHQLLREKLVADQAPKSLRAFYELWLECAEQVYQKWLRTEAFVSVFSEAVNGIFR